MPDKSQPPSVFTMWKTGPQPRIKPVIARDTTCSVSLLTGTICGSNFAIPSNKFRLTGMGRNSKAVKSSAGKDAARCPARGDSAPPQVRKGSGARASRSVSPAPGTLKRTASSISGSQIPEPGSRFECGGRSPTLPRGTTTTVSAVRNGSTQSSVTCPPADQGTSFLRHGSRTQEPAMEGLSRLVSESLARHGFDRPLDYRRLHWSRWFRCESHHSLLFIPSKTGVFAIAEEIMDWGTGQNSQNDKNDHVGTAAPRS